MTTLTLQQASEACQTNKTAWPGSQKMHGTKTGLFTIPAGKNMFSVSADWFHHIQYI
ncbi:hypothetical protein AAGU66_13470 [Edwardsiella ictaluri]|uniref:Uncharacterized protein n=2 Tax=Edwardsiella ictaluri TaxID=67780 RepID=C5BAL5_EDWI9|nr:hypothetical protein [Edwardsiella ictaluri]ACR70222.1 hypothetical protein NT01EI_3072 [Edwardsiella ictaluri 93-146]EKS7762432.1 hypothetical protein [Edwardsiella ictaluri]EKS7770829.1 hypothetical protein [Edwardsiella ictaluri]EKS7773973.1 hypothetical protein [Edwardsiella ictaluri]EKS7776047.1 hypothetical protein [Edwardsiella ictaluri]